MRIAHDRLVLDTSAYRWFREGHGPIVDLMAGAEVVCVPSIVVGELLAGFALGSRRASNEVSLSDFLREPFVEVVDADVSVARRYAEVFAALRRAGTPIPTNDVWIAAATLAVEGHLATYDTDFSHVATLRSTLFEPPYP